MQRTNVKRILLFSATFVAAFLFIHSVAAKDADVKPVRAEEHVDDAATGTGWVLSRAGTAYQDMLVETSDTVTPTTPFNGIAFDWISVVPNGTEAKILFRVREHGDWSDWYPLEATHDIRAPETTFEQLRLFSDPWFFSMADAYQYRVVLHTDDPFLTPRIEELRATTIDSTRGPDPTDSDSLLTWMGVAPTVQAAGAKIISRKDWGADESLRYTNGKEIWPPEYYDVKKFIVHHTAGSDGGSDPAATIRGIYYYHAVSRGWGDIGYNFLIDPAGNIYKGRVGGTGVAGAHAYDEQTDTDYNRGTVGIAVLGNYETVDRLTANSEDALAELIADKAHDAGVSPYTTSTFNGKKTKNILGHKDVDATACPGTHMYKKLDDIRNATKEYYLAGLAYAAERVTKSVPSPTTEGDDSTVVVKYKNVGTKTWNRSKTRFTVFDLNGAPTLFRDESWGATNGLFRIQEESVAPGGTATITYTQQSPGRAGRYQQEFRFQVDSTAVVGSDFSVISTIQSPYRGKLLSVDAPIAVKQGWRFPVTFELKNLGDRTWDSGVRVRLQHVTGAPSPFRDSTWSDAFTPVDLSAGPIAPGEVGEATAWLSAPRATGVHATAIHLDVVGQYRLVEGVGYAWLTRVDP